MNTQIHTVLGASGGAGYSVFQELNRRNYRIRVVERTARFDNVETKTADLLDLEQACSAIEGSSYVYLCVGLPYNHKVWRRDWPVLMHNVIEACHRTNAVLIFLDNIYLYGPPPLAVPFDENHPRNPITRKGKIRKTVADLMQKALDEKKIRGAIARAADFYGPNAKNSLLYIVFLENMLKGKAPLAVGRTDKKHTYVYTPDIGKAMIMMAEDPSCYGDVWHIPVGEPVTLEEAAETINRQLGTDLKISRMPGILKTVLSWFMVGLAELNEMLYQYEHDYIMSHEKFMEHFQDFEITPFEEGMRVMIESFERK